MMCFFPSSGMVSIDENTPHPREPLQKGLGKVAFKWFNIELQIKGKNNLFLLPFCKLQQSLVRRQQW
jgi:hypothetical protein